MFRDEEGIGALLMFLAIGWLYQCVGLCGLQKRSRRPLKARDDVSDLRHE
jgi:hypothetical protein